MINKEDKYLSVFLFLICFTPLAFIGWFGYYVMLENIINKKEINKEIKDEIIIGFICVISIYSFILYNIVK